MMFSLKVRFRDELLAKECVKAVETIVSRENAVFGKVACSCSPPKFLWSEDESGIEVGGPQVDPTISSKMPKRKIGALEKVDADLSSLQYKIGRDPSSYEGDFINQLTLYEHQRDIFMEAPSSATAAGIVSLRDLIDFVSHVADRYPGHTKDFPQDLMRILTIHHRDLEPELRGKIVGSLVLLRRKEVIDSSTLLNTLFPILTSTSSKTLRALLFQKILSDLRTSNSNAKNHRLNRMTQNVLYELICNDRASRKGVWAVKLVRDLWRRQIWTDSKTVDIMKEASLADNEKVVIGGIQFFLGGDREREELEDESSDNDAVEIGKIKHQMAINKKNKKKAKMMTDAVDKVKRKERKKKQPHILNFSAFHLLHNPQGFAEDLFQKHVQNSRSKLNLQQKLMVLQLVSRLVGLHKLTIINLYSYFIRYLTPRQPSVTSFLASLAQATHNLVPPDVLEPLIQKIANEFVSEAAAAEVASAGLNAIREICVRQPLAMNDTLLQDLVMYRKSKDKGVVMAARGLLSLYREVAAEMLKKKDRGKEVQMGIRKGLQKEGRFGEEPAGQIEGLELLEQWKEEERQKQRLEKGLPAVKGSDEEESEEDVEGAGDWEIDESDSGEDSGGWINVESDREISISDSDDDDKRTAKKAKLEAKVNVPGDSDDKENTNTNDVDKPTSDPLHFATTRILTPADLAKLQELRLSASIDSHLPASQRKRTAQAAALLQSRHADDPLTATEIEGLASLSKKSSKADKIAKAKEGKQGDDARKSTQAKRKEKKEEMGKSSTNKEKARKKNFLMTLGKGKVKNKRSLIERGRVLKAHVERGKRGGKRGNKGK